MDRAGFHTEQATGAVLWQGNEGMFAVAGDLKGDDSIGTGGYAATAAGTMMNVDDRNSL